MPTWWRSRTGEPLSAASIAWVAVLGALAGAAAGSYTGVVAARGWRGSLSGRSMCDGCGRELRWWELVPVVSWLALRGRCVRCRTAIPPSLLLREVIGAILGAGVGLLTGLLASR